MHNFFCRSAHKILKKIIITHKYHRETNTRVLGLNHLTQELQLWF